MTTNTDTARNQAVAQYESIVDLMEWLDHAQSLENMNDECTFFESECTTAARDQGADAHDVDAATQAIHDNALSVEVRSGWYTPETLQVDRMNVPLEFQILLCTHEPAVRIMGELDEHAEPSHAWLEYQDWGTEWTEHYQTGIRDTLVRYASQFYFGE